MKKRKSALVRRVEQIRADPSAACKHIRSTLGLTQEALARLCDVSFVTVNRWEHGQKPTWARGVLVLAKLARSTGYRPPQRKPKVKPKGLERVRLSPIPRERRQQLFEMQTQARREMEQEFEERQQLLERQFNER